MAQSTAYRELKAQYKRQRHIVHAKESVTNSMNTLRTKLLEQQSTTYSIFLKYLSKRK